MKKIYNQAKCFLVCLSLISANSVYSQCSTCTLTGWQYEKEVIIDNSANSTSYTNYQELLTIDTQTPISQGKMNVAGNDIRFIDGDCSTPLCYVIESGINTTSTKIWVVVPSIPANTIKTFFMFYGNAGAPATSNLSCVFSDILTVTGPVTLSGVQNHDIIDIQAGATVTVGAGQILSLKARKITVAGNIDGNYAGYGPAAGPGPGGNGGGSDGGGGGGYGGAGGSGKCPGGNSGAASGTANGLDLDMGSGGGGSDCNPADGGGGAVKLEATIAIITGNITVNGYTTGGSCSEEAAGGGSGGGILVYANEINGAGTLNAKGGNGQASNAKEGGGGGGGGRIKLFYCSANNYTGTTDVTKGAPGSGGQCSADDAQNGSSTVNTFTCELITIGPEQHSIYQIPSSAFIAPFSICAATDSSIVYTGNATPGATFVWNFDGGAAAPGTGQGPHITHWLNAGTKTVTLSVTSADGCVSDTSTATVIVKTVPVANSGPAVSFCSGDSAALGVASTLGYSYLWSPTTGLSSSTISNPTVHLTNTTAIIDTVPYTITVSENGCSSTDFVPVTVFPIPVASFVSPPGQCFNNNSFNFYGGGTFLPNPNFIWSFGATATPDSSHVQNPTAINFSNSGYHVVSFKIVSHNCVSNVSVDSVNVYPAPVTNFTFANVCLHQSINFIDSSFVPGAVPTVYGWSWNFGDGSPAATLQSPVYTYTTAGTYPVSLITHSAFGCFDTLSQNVTVHPLPTALYSATNVCDGNAIQFINSSTIPNTDSIQSFFWNFGDNSTIANTQTISHLYTAVGSYQVQLLAISSFGCKDSINKTVFVNSAPLIKFSVTDTIGCAPLCIFFNDSSTVSGGGISTWAWSIGDGSAVNNQQNFEHCYANSSVDSSAYFNISLTVTSDSGSVKTITKNNYITVHPHPNASFTVQPQTTSITDPVVLATDFSTGAISWNWNFGDSLTSSLQQPLSHTYKQVGDYTVRLIVTSNHGCLDTVSRIISIEPDFVFYIPNAFSPDGDGVNDTFNGKGIFITEYQMKIFDRWGNAIFTSNDINTPWDGKVNDNSEPAQTDTYVYSIKLVDSKDRPHSYKGIVTLVR